MKTLVKVIQFVAGGVFLALVVPQVLLATLGMVLSIPALLGGALVTGVVVGTLG